jgi:hypothetical protein
MTEPQKAIWREVVKTEAAEFFQYGVEALHLASRDAVLPSCGVAFHSRDKSRTCDQMATICLSFMEGIDRKNNTNAKFRFLPALLRCPPGNLPAHGRMGSGGPT